MSERTMVRYLSDPTFRAELRAASKELLEQTGARMRSAAGQALAVLIEQLGDTGHPSIRQKAALGILAHTGRWMGDEVLHELALAEQEHGGSITPHALAIWSPHAPGNGGGVLG